MTTSKRQFLNVPYGAYYNEPIPQENVDLTHVERGSRSGELLRRYWQPIAMSSQVRDPPGTDLHKRLCHGAYPAREYRGLVFGYFGPPEERPEFPVYDSFEFDGDELVPYSLHYPCNWLQVHENVMDPVHTVFLHTQISYSHFADVWGELPLHEYVRARTVEH